MQSEREYNYKISEIGNYLAQWKSLEILPKEALQSIAKFVLQEKSQSFAEGKKQGRSEVENTAKCGCCGAPMVSIRGKYPKLESRIICPVCAYETLEQIHEISNPSSRIPCSSKCSNQSLAEGK